LEGKSGGKKVIPVESRGIGPKRRLKRNTGARHPGKGKRGEMLLHDADERKKCKDGLL